MKRWTLLPVLALLIFSSCQKEISWDNEVLPPPGGNPTGERLVKTVSEENGQTQTTTYTYTADGKIEIIDMTGISGGIDVGNFRRFYRDANGRIVRIAQKAADQGGIEIDTVFTDVYYPDATTLNCSYTITTLSLLGISTTDSTVYTYDADGRVTQRHGYMGDGLVGEQETKIDYSYSAAGNISNITGYNNISGTMEVVTTLDLEYDDKVNPLSSSQELLVSGGGPGSSKNNVTVINFNGVSNPDIQVITNVYTYGATGLPATMKSTDSGTGITTNYTFYYE